MKKAFAYVIVSMLLLGGLGTGVLSIAPLSGKKNDDITSKSYPDISAYRYAIAMRGDQGIIEGFTLGSNQQSLPVKSYPIGTLIWQYTITGGSDNSPKSIVSHPDINGDQIDDVIIGSEDYYIRCFSGGAIGTGQVLWGVTITSGSVYNQGDIAIIPDVNGDGVDDVVVGATGGARLIRCLSGSNGLTIWTHDTHEYGSGGWVYQVDCTYDYNGDGVRDVLACTGADPNRVYCLNGLTGVSIWEYPLGGPGFSVIGVRDFTGDGIPDVVAGCSNAAETIGYAKGINGATGALAWSFTTSSSAGWSVGQMSDVTGDGIDDVVVGDFSGHVYGLNAATGAQIWVCNVGSGAIVTHVVRLNDVNLNGYDDILVGHSGQMTVQLLDGLDGSLIWGHSTADQPWNVARLADISGDGVDDVVVGTLYTNNYAYFLSGVDGSELTAPISYGQALDAIAAIPDVVNDGSMEMMAGGRDGKVTCYSGGLNASQGPMHLTADFIADPRSGETPLQVQFNDTSVAENTTITSWKWDFNHDGIIDSTVQNPLWIYTEPGNYTVSLTVSNGHLTDTMTKEDYITVLQGKNPIVIGNVTGGLMKIQAEIHNNGTLNLSQVQWSFTVSGGFVLLGKTKEDMIFMLAGGQTEVIVDRPVLGLGKVTIEVTAKAPDYEKATKTVEGVLLFFFVIIR